ncbi:cation:proton antiporter family protein [Streptomyces alkaliterrae]|uniref:Cation:proton antiporter n=1 Tax=Streptomyces alkaliterrae TaxID=2213162 RepID=A0A5P0YLQ5_9ACTN|nr:cation:proton antiporter family protein [Streptomyces alkaliterrae]MBB1251815.1 cation:proton antiporter [Streptomyces alkaliterrae]MBB1257826.1 cation:proton antiporter [Streptomyces alkaliterrae]MQS01178.1 potassium transporter Kef [Streptomyces alkaliterrae]
MEPAYLLAPFVGGLLAMAIRLPPLVGFLAAGFALKAMGYGSVPALETIADLGVTLLLFTIGLKLNVRTLLRKEVWGSATLHMVASTGVFVGALALLKALGFSLLAGAGLQSFAVIAFALSFSSTVFAVKVLEERSESRSLYGRTAIGVLIMQDIFAVVFLTASTGKVPSPWALGLVLLIPLSAVLRRLLPRVGHGEMQILFGVVLALVLGYALFEQLGMKGDLGALIIGMLLAPHPSAAGLSKSLFNMKELFLVGFFVSIGLTALPSWDMVGLALLLVALVPLKSLLFLLIFSGFRLRKRTSFLATLSLSNFSEFGLIVAVVAAAQGWVTDEWLVVLSLAVALSFVLAAVFNSRSRPLYTRVEPRMRDRDVAQLHPDDRPIEIGRSQVVVLGMGRVGRGAYDRLTDAYGLDVLGVDTDVDKVTDLQQAGYSVLEGDATDEDFWEKLTLAEHVELVVLAMPHHAGNFFALEQLRHQEFRGRIAAAVTHFEEIEPLERRGAHAVFHLYEEAGTALADSAAEVAGLAPVGGVRRDSVE